MASARVPEGDPICLSACMIDAHIAFFLLEFRLNFQRRTLLFWVSAVSLFHLASFLRLYCASSVLVPRLSDADTPSDTRQACVLLSAYRICESHRHLNPFG